MKIPSQDEIIGRWSGDIDKPVVSVVCPAYNHEKYISAAIRSFLYQETTFPFEIIIHDDASTDKTTEIIRKYERAYPKIIKPIYQKENKYSQGIVIFTKEIFRHIRGEYIAVCEGDDYWCSEYKLQKCYDYLKAHSDCSMVSHLTDVIRYDLKKKMHFNPDFLQSGGVLGSYDTLIEANLIHYSSQFYRRKLISDNFSFFIQTYAYDMDFVMAAATEGYIYVIPEVMSVYRYWTSGSWSVRTDDDPDELKLISMLECARKTTELLNEYRDYKYDGILSERSRRISFHLCQLHGELKKVKSNEYKDLYSSMPLYEKIIVRYKAFPKPIRRFIRKNVRPLFLKIYLSLRFGISDSHGFSEYKR